jgi:hypothetical protein
MHVESDLQVMNLHVAALFVSDVTGRIRFINEPGYPAAELDPAPRFWMGRTTEGNIWRFRHDLPDDVVHALEQVCRTEPAAQRGAAPPLHAAAIRATLHAHAPSTREDRGPAYWIPARVQARGEVVLIEEGNKHLLAHTFPWVLTAPSGFHIGPLTAVVVAGRAVSICHCARITAQAAEAGVETVEAVRGQGYASAAVAGWAAAVRERGLLPLYSTSWENVASQGVARKLGMVRYGEDWSIT